MEGICWDRGSIKSAEEESSLRGMGTGKWAVKGRRRKKNGRGEERLEKMPHKKTERHYLSDRNDAQKSRLDSCWQIRRVRKDRCQNGDFLKAWVCKRKVLFLQSPA